MNKTKKYILGFFVLGFLVSLPLTTKAFTLDELMSQLVNLKQEVSSLRSQLQAQTRATTVPTTSTTTLTTKCAVGQAPWIKVVSPNGGETFTAGQQITVKWTSCNIPASATLSINSDWIQAGGPNFSTSSLNSGIKSFVMPNNYIGEFKFIVSSRTNNATDFYNAIDYSDNTFTINSANTKLPLIPLVTPTRCEPGQTPWIKVLSPNGGETFIAGQPITVKWTSCNIPASANNINIYLWFSVPNDPIHGWGQTLTSGPNSVTVNDGSETLNLSSTDFIIANSAQFGKNYKIGVTSRFVGGPTYDDKSDNLFTINSAPTTTSPLTNSSTQNKTLGDTWMKCPPGFVRTIQSDGVCNIDLTNMDVANKTKESLDNKIKCPTGWVKKDAQCLPKNDKNIPAKVQKAIDNATKLGTPSFGEKLLVIGGEFPVPTWPNSQYGEVWETTNGNNWQMISNYNTWSGADNSTNLKPRSDSSAVYFKGKIFVIGGYCNGGNPVCQSEIYTSTDGKKWTLLNSNLVNLTSWNYDNNGNGFTYAFNDNNSAVIFNNKIWLRASKAVCPASGNCFNSNSFLTSADGINWVAENPVFPWTNKVVWDSSFTVFKNKLWLIGGYLYDPITYQGSFSSSVYSSVDGINWMLEKANAAFGGKTSMLATIFGDKIVLVGGYGANNFQFVDDVWSSSDGKIWTKKSNSLTGSTLNWLYTWDNSLITFKNKIYLIGLSPWSNNSNMNYNDYTWRSVWSSADGGANWSRTTEFSLPNKLRATAVTVPIMTTPVFQSVKTQ